MYEIVVNKNEDKKTILLLENGILTEVYEETPKQNRLEGNIYLGKVQNVLPGMQAAFVNIGQNKNTFIHLKDILPKYDVKQNIENKTIDNIKELLKPGMPIIVQVKRDSTIKKGARVSTHMSLSGRFTVLMPNTSFITISQKIEDEKEKLRLANILKEIVPEECGAIIRTAALNKSEIDIKNDIQMLINRWNKIKQDAGNNMQDCPRLLEKCDSLIKKLLIDLVDQTIHKITVNDKQTHEEISKILKEMNLDKQINIEMEQDGKLLEKYGLDKQLEKMQNRKIWLKCGGFITIDKTEALTAIDVNSGKYIGTKNLEKTAFTVNKEATVEIAKQIRLRDIDGIIIIDYIDMIEEEHKERIEQLMKENLKKDRSKNQILGFTKLNLLEMTRKHMVS